MQREASLGRVTELQDSFVQLQEEVHSLHRQFDAVQTTTAREAAEKDGRIAFLTDRMQSICQLLSKAEAEKDLQADRIVQLEEALRMVGCAGGTRSRFDAWGVDGPAAGRHQS